MSQANIEVLALAAVNMRHEYNDANAADEIMNAVRELCYLRERNAILERNPPHLSTTADDSEQK